MWCHKNDKSCTEVSEGWTRCCTGIKTKVSINITKIFMTKKWTEEWKNLGMDELMTALINWQYAAAPMLANSCKKQERPTPISLTVSSDQGGLQWSIDVRIEKWKIMDIWKSNSALSDMAIEDFLYFENLPDRAVEFNGFCKILDISKVLCSGFTILSRTKIGDEIFFNWKCFKKCSYKKFIHTQVNC